MATRFFDDDGRTYAYLDSGKLVLTDVASAQFKRSGRLDLSGNLDLIELPEGLRVDQLFLREVDGRVVPLFLYWGKCKIHRY